MDKECQLRLVEAHTKENHVPTNGIKATKESNVWMPTFVFGTKRQALWIVWVAGSIFSTIQAVRFVQCGSDVFAWQQAYIVDHACKTSRRIGYG